MTSPSSPSAGPDGSDDTDAPTDTAAHEAMLAAAAQRALAGNLAKGAAKLAEQGKLFVRDRIDLLVDPGSFVEDGLLANAAAADLPADGVVTGTGTVDGRPVCIMANDPTVKAGSWGARTVEKIVRLTEKALADELPVFWLVDSAGARITDQVELFPGRRGAGRIFYNQVRLSGRVPQICCLFGPSAAGGAYIPSFCDIVIMVEGNASMYLGSPRMAEMVIGEITTLEEMGGARMHASVSGCGDNLAVDDEDALDQARAWFSYFPLRWRDEPPLYHPAEPSRPLTRQVLPQEEAQGYDMHAVLDGLLDAESFFELKPLFAPELITGLGRIDGRPVGIVANNPLQKGGVPSIVERTLIRPPAGRMGPLSEEERKAIVEASPFKGKYDEALDRESAHEVLNGRREAEPPPPVRKAETRSGGIDWGARPAARPAPRDDGAGSVPRAGSVRDRLPEAQPKKEESGGWLSDIFGGGGGRRQSVGEAAVKSAARSVGSSLGREISRSILGGILGGRRR